MTAHGLLTFALVYLVFVITPGPGIGAIVARGLGIGFRHAVPFVAGFILGDVAWFTLAACGLAAVATHYTVAFIVLKYAGCLYLMWLAYKMWVSPVASSDVVADPSATTAWGSFAGSLTLTLSNPKVMVFFVSLMPVVVEVKGITLGSYAVMASIMVLMGGLGITSYLLMARQARRVFSSSKALKRINRSAAALMAGAAATIAAKG